MGSGQPIVDPFLGLMSKAFCSTARPLNFNRPVHHILGLELTLSN